MEYLTYRMRNRPLMMMFTKHWVLPLSGAMRVKKLGRPGSCDFPTNSCRLSTKKIMCAQNLYCAREFFQSGLF